MSLVEKLLDIDLKRLSDPLLLALWFCSYNLVRGIAHGLGKLSRNMTVLTVAKTHSGVVPHCLYTAKKSSTLWLMEKFSTV